MEEKAKKIVKKEESKVEEVKEEKQITLGPLPQIQREAWLDISKESWREYSFPDMRVRIVEPARLYVTTKITSTVVPIDSHRIVDKAGQPHYIPVGWRYLNWETTSDNPFDF